MSGRTLGRLGRRELDSERMMSDLFLRMPGSQLEGGLAAGRCFKLTDERSENVVGR